MYSNKTLLYTLYISLHVQVIDMCLYILNDLHTVNSVQSADTHGTYSVRWLGKSSDHFEVSNGVRQGGVLSPILFTIYLDGLLDSLHTSGRGCY